MTPSRRTRRSSAAAVVDEAHLVEAVAPGDVLERVLADRRPEAGRGVPRGVLARGVAARDLALVERLAPVLDRQRPAGGGVARERDVARGEDAVGARAHVRVVTIRPSSRRARRLGEPRAGLDADREEHEVGVERVAAGDAHAPRRRSRSTPRRAAASTPSVARARRRCRAGRLARAARAWGTGSSVTSVTAQPAHARARRRPRSR